MEAPTPPCPDAALLEALYERVPVGVIVLRGGVVAHVNPRAASLLGGPAASIRGRTLEALGVALPDGEQLARARLGEEDVTLSLVALDPDRWAVFMLPAEAPVHPDAQRSPAFLRQVIDMNPSLIFVKDREGAFRLVNQAVAKVYGTTTEELVGKTDADFNDNAEEVERFRRDDLDVMDSLAEKQIVQETVTDAEGRARVLQTVKRPLIDADGVARHVLGVATDVTRLKETEAERRALEAQVLHAQKLESLGVLAGGIAHDFNNMLVGVLGNADVLERLLPPSAPTLAAVHHIQLAARRAGDLCKQLLSYSGRGRMVVEPVDLSAEVREMSHLLEVSVAKGVRLVLELDDELPAVHADPTQLRQVIMNLITNASEAYGESGGDVRLTTSQRSLAGGGRKVRLTVEDAGPGMDDRTRARIFDPFFTTKVHGRGLGLAAVQGIVRAHDGEIEVDSAPGRGTRFSVTLPAIEAPASRSSSSARRPVPGSGTVLVVDDEESVRETARRILVMSGYAVIEAVDGRDAVRVFDERREEIVCVLMDLTMPRGGGEQALAELRERDPDVRVVLMSGYDEQEVGRRAVAGRRAAFLQKPFRLHDLLEAVAAAREDA